MFRMNLFEITETKILRDAETTKRIEPLITSDIGELKVDVSQKLLI